jgi:hypothetical protein
MKKLITLALMCAFALGAATLGSCSKDDKDPIFQWGGTKVTGIAYAAYQDPEYYSQGGYTFALYQRMPGGEADLWDEPGSLMVQIPTELMGERINLVDGEYDFGWVPYGQIDLGGNYAEWWINNSGEPSDALSGTGNWLKVTQNSDNNFTIEIHATVDGKLLKCYYKGTFTLDDRL